jgi:hypothetical protein
MVSRHNVPSYVSVTRVRQPSAPAAIEILPIIVHPRATRFEVVMVLCASMALGA